MATINVERHQMIRRAVLQRPDEFLEVTVHLWERLATELISLIGENGFQSLYVRSVLLTRATYPWIVEGNPAQPTEKRFTGLQHSLANYEFDVASAASILLLTTLVDIISLLIGDLLMTRILGSAWGVDAPDTAGKELQE
jgi:hypothetical protein